MSVIVGFISKFCLFRLFTLIHSDVSKFHNYLNMFYKSFYKQIENRVSKICYMLTMFPFCYG